MIANAVDLPGHPAITRRPACDLQADSDLGRRLVTTAVAPLSPQEAQTAVDRGAAAGQAALSRGLIDGALIFLHPAVRTLGTLRLKEPELA